MIQHSEEIGKVMAAILAVQQAVDHVDKNQTNPHFGNSYVDLNTFLHALREPLAEHGLVMTQAPGMENGNVLVDTMLYHESGEWIRDRAAAPMQKADPQGVGSAITYLRRYSLAALFAIPQEDDDGNAASTNQSAGRSKGKPTPSGDDYHCPDCGGAMWDNRADKEAGKVKPKYPDFKCKDKACDNAIWGSHPDDKDPAALAVEVQDALNSAATLDLLTIDQAARVEEVLDEGEVDALQRALDWLNQKLEVGKMQGAEKTKEAAPA